MWFYGLIITAITLGISNPTFDGDHFAVDAVVDGLSSGSACFVQGMFTAKDKTKYFGFTYNSQGVWQEYLSAPSPETVTSDFIPLTNGQVKQIFIKSNPADPDYKGPGEYLLKLKRYTGGANSGSSAGESNELIVTISDITPTPSPTPTPTHSPSPTSPTTPTTQTTPTSTRTPISTPTATPKPSVTAKLIAALSPTVLSPTVSASPSAEIASPSALITAATTSSPPTLPESAASHVSTRSPLYLILAGLAVFSLSAVMLTLHLRARGPSFAKITKYG